MGEGKVTILAEKGSKQRSPLGKPTECNYYPYVKFLGIRTLFVYMIKILSTIRYATKCFKYICTFREEDH